jgi:protein subunit release factor A
VEVTHLPTGIGIEADVRDTVGGNERVALQAIALQVRDRREREAAW